MKIYLISALICLAGLAHGASIQRIARNTEAIIPTIVEEILKVELQSDLKKNSAVEAIEEEPLVKKIDEEIIVEPVASRTIEEAVAPLEEKQPEIVEVVAIKEIDLEPISAIRKTEPAVEVVEKVEVITIQENVDKPIDNFRTESIPSVEMPSVPEITKETVVVEPVSDLRQEPAVEVVIKEEEIVKPMVRNVIKEEIPQIEELRNILPEEIVAIKDVIPEPVPSSNIVEPVVEIVPQVKTVLKEQVQEDKIEVPAPVDPEIKTITEVKTVPETVIVPETKVEVKTTSVFVPVVELKEEKIDDTADIKAVPADMPVTDMKAVPEVKPMSETVEEADPQILRQDRPSIVQQLQTAATNVLQNVPILNNIIANRPSSAVASDESVSDEAAAPPPNLIQSIVSGTQNAFNQAQTAFQNSIANVANAINPSANNAAEGAETTTRAPQGPLIAAFQNAVGVVQNIVNPTTAKTPLAEEKPSDEKPIEAEKPKTDEQVKSVEPELVVAVDPVVVQKETSETQKVVEEEKENLVKN